MDIDIDNTLLFDPGISLTAAKAYLKDNGFTDGFGQDLTIQKFRNFVDHQTSEGKYAGKSVEFGAGGRAAILKHQLIISGKYGDTLEDITNSDWSDINQISRINFFRKYGP